MLSRRGRLGVGIVAVTGLMVVAAHHTALPGGPPSTVAVSTAAGLTAAMVGPATAVPKPVVPETAAAPEIDPVQGLALAGDGWGDAAPTVVEPVQRRMVSLGRGGTLMQVMLDADVPTEMANEAVAALRTVYNPRRMQQGQEIALLFDRTDGDRFIGLEFQPAVATAIRVNHDGEGFVATEEERPLRRTFETATATIDSSLYAAGTRAGVPMPILAALIRAYSYDVDFQRDVHRGDGLELVYERWLTEEGEPARDGDIHFAALTLSGKRMPLYRFEDGDGQVDFYNEKGESIRRALLRTPVDGARISSGFGMRRHPIQGFTKMHKGVDFAAPTGTPIYAAGDGTIEEVGSKGAYGNYIRIRHNGEVSTAYAHLSRFGKGMRRGGRVAQGDVIGFVGSTGRSTGPHLHYEVHKRGRQVNPLTVTMPTGRTLAGAERQRFLATVAELEARMRGEEPASALLVSATTRAEPTATPVAPPATPAMETAPRRERPTMISGIVIPRMKPCASAPGC